MIHEFKEMERIAREEAKSSDAFYDKRAVKEEKKKTGGVKKQSPVWDDE
jgi:hypothetical protein